MKVNGLNVEVNRKNINNLHLSVMPSNGWVRVSSPVHVDDDAIRLFVLSKYGWIIEKQKQFKDQLRQDKREYVSGESHFLFGNRYILLVEKSKGYSVKTKGKNIIYNVRKNSTIKQREYHYEKWNRELLKEKITFFIKKWEKIMNISPDSWKIKKMITKWGTCNNKKKTILFNLKLAKKPLECIEYIVVHEMCHLIYKTHSKEFENLLSQLLPFWSETQKTLNDLYLDLFKDTR